MALTDQVAGAVKQRPPEPAADAEVRRIQRRTDLVFKVFIACGLVSLVLVLLAIELNRR